MDHKVLIVGAGFSGLGMGIKLKQQGEDEFMIYERGSELGGTWFYNTYPGAACDVPSLMYSYSFAPKYDWKQPWANHKEIFEYMKDVAYNQNDMHDHFTFGVECTNADWKEEKGLWKVTFRNLSSGAVFTKTTKVLITACGSFSNPNDCPVKGKERFRGKIFHSSRWDHSAELEGKNVVVIGNGCTAAQVVPAVAKKAKHVTQIIRSAHNIVPVPFPNKPTSTLYQNLLLYVPGLHTFLRFLLFCILDLGFLSFVTENRFARGRLDKQCKEHIKKNAPKRYVDMLTPKFEFGAKRRIIDYDYLPALHRDNVDLMLEEMKEINKNGLLLKSGKMIDADVIVYCTGFKVEEYMMPMKVTGENGVDLHDQWESLGFQAYKGGYVHNFPNLVLLMGPNTGTGHHSVIFASECQINHALGYLKPLLNDRVACKKIQLKKAAEISFNAWVQKRMKMLIWSDGGAGGWYIQKATGKNAVVYPHFQSHYWWTTLWVKWSDFVLVS